MIVYDSLWYWVLVVYVNMNFLQHIAAQFHQSVKFPEDLLTVASTFGFVSQEFGQPDNDGPRKRKWEAHQAQHEMAESWQVRFSLAPSFVFHSLKQFLFFFLRSKKGRILRWFCWTSFKAFIVGVFFVKFFVSRRVIGGRSATTGLMAGQRRTRTKSKRPVFLYLVERKRVSCLHQFFFFFFFFFYIMLHLYICTHSIIHIDAPLF